MQTPNYLISSNFLNQQSRTDFPRSDYSLRQRLPTPKRRITNGQGSDSTVQAVMLNTARVKTSGSGECNGGHSDEPENSEIAAGSTVAESPVMLNPKTPSCEGCPSNRVVPSINLCGFLETACSQDPFAKSQFQQRSDSTVQAVMLNTAKVKTSPSGECNGGHPERPRVKQAHQLVYTGV